MDCADVGTFAMGDGDGKSDTHEVTSKASTVTCIYLNNVSTSDLWEHQKRDFHQGQDDECTYITDEVFLVHLLKIHAQFCAEPSCKCMCTQCRTSECDVIGGSENEVMELDIKIEPDFIDTSQSADSAPSSINMLIHHSPDPSAFTESEISLRVSSSSLHTSSTTLAQGPSEVDRHLSSPADAEIDQDSESHDQQRDLGAIESSALSHDQCRRESIAVRSPDVSHDVQRELVTMELKEIITEEGIKYEDTTDHQEGAKITSREKKPPPNLGGAPGKQALQKGETSTSNSRLNTDVLSEDHLEIINVDSDNDISGQYTCNLCSKTFVSNMELLRHKHEQSCVVFEKRSDVQKECSKAFTLEHILVDHMRPHTGEGSFICSVCSKAFFRKSNLSRHMRIHTGERPFICEVCSKAFSKTSNLARHMRTHTGERPFICDICSKAFFEKGSLKVHRRIHTGERPFICSVCSKGFADKSNLTVHMRTHTGEKPYTCSICSKAFALKHALVGHMRTHSGERPFTCSICSKSFTNKQQLLRHVRRHTSTNESQSPRPKPFICDICSKSFADKSSLIVHRRAHTGERPFICNVCSKTFTDKGNLTVHMRTHTGEKPYTCDICSKAFIHRNSLVRHKILHTGERPITDEI